MAKIPQIVKTIQQHPILEVDYRYQKSISYSQFSIYQGCQHRWKLQYKDGHDVSSFSIHTCFGTAVHEAIQHYLTIMFETSGAEADRFDIEEYFKEKFIEQLESALIRIENKTYGICRVTGKLIPKERLRAVPHTTQSMEAKLNQYKN